MGLAFLAGVCAGGGGNCVNCPKKLWEKFCHSLSKKERGACFCGDCACKIMRVGRWVYLTEREF